MHRLPSSSSMWRCGFLALLLLMAPLVSRAQSGGEITEQALTAPWTSHLAVVAAARTVALTPADAAALERRIDRLTLAQVTLGEYESQVDRVIERLGYDTQFGFAAAETSLALSAQLDEIAKALDALYAELGIQARDDVRRAQAQLAELSAALAKKDSFERDVVNALGSGFRQQRVDLATRWWKGEEQAIELRKQLAQWREQLNR